MHKPVITLFSAHLIKYASWSHSTGTGAAMRFIDKRFLIFLIILSLAGCAVVWLATSRYGAGLSSDAVRIISAGQNVIEGRGLVISTGDPLIFWPPYYSILLGLLSAIFKSDVFTIGMILNILAFGNIIFWAGILLLRIQPTRPFYAIAGSLVVASSPSLIRICANVAPDPLFILFIIWFLIAATSYMRSPTHRSLAGLTLTALLCASQRYPGLAVVLSGAILILWRERKQLWRALRDIAIFSLISSAPTLGYIYFHNYLGYGTLIGPRFSPNPPGNILIALEKMTHWIIPGSITLRTGIWPWIGLGLGLLLVGLFFAWKSGRLKTLRESIGLPPALIFLFIYSLTLIFLVSYKEHYPLLVDRIHIVILVPLVVVLMELLPVLIPQLEVHRNRWSRILLAAGFIIWLIYPVFSSYRYVGDSIRDGDVSIYNLHNTREIRESDLAKYLEIHPFPEGAALISNYNETAWFLTRRQVGGVPTANKAEGWPVIDGDTYLIWFDLPELNYMPKTMLTLDEITGLVGLKALYTGADGSVYQLTAE
jgi:hypothetical protein